MASNCRSCGLKITSNTNAKELRIGKWEDKLKAFGVVILLCKKCFDDLVQDQLYDRERKLLV